MAHLYFKHFEKQDLYQEGLGLTLALEISTWGCGAILFRKAYIYFEQAQEHAYLLFDVGTGDINPGLQGIPIREAFIYLEEAQERANLLFDVDTGDINVVLRNTNQRGFYLP